MSSSSYTVILVTNILMYVVMTLSWAIFSGPTGYISLAPAAFFGVGVYASALFSDVLPLPLVILIGGLASFVLAYLVGSVTLRLKGMYFTMFTFGLVELVRNSRPLVGGQYHGYGRENDSFGGYRRRLLLHGGCLSRRFSSPPTSSSAPGSAWPCRVSASPRRRRPIRAST